MTATQQTLVVDDTPTIGLDQLVIDPTHNVRETVTDASVADLADSIEELGIHTAVLVTTNGDGKYHLKAGYRRCHAAQVVEKRTKTKVRIPYTVIAGSEADIEAAHLLENLHREDLNPIEEATGIARLVELGTDQKTLARQIGRSQSHITGRLKLLQLPKKATDALKAGDLPIGIAELLVQLDPERQAEVMKGKDWARHLHQHTVEHYIGVQKRSREMDKKIADLTTAGVTVIDLRQKGVTLPKGASEVAQSEWGRGLQFATPTRHEKEPCRILAIVPDRYNGHAYETEHCSDPKRHDKAGDSKLKVTKKAALSGPTAAEKKRRQQEAEFETRALTQLQDIVAGGATKAQLGDLAIDMLIASAWASDTAQACKLLGLDRDHEHAVTAKDDGTGEFLPKPTLEAYEKASKANADRARYARILAHHCFNVVDEYAPRYRNSDTDDARRRHVEAKGFDPGKRPT